MVILQTLRTQNLNFQKQSSYFIVALTHQRDITHLH